MLYSLEKAEEKHESPVSGMRGDTTADAVDIKRIRKFCEKLYANKTDDLNSIHIQRLYSPITKS